MKKFTFIMVAAIAISMASCTAQSPKPSLKNDIDTLSYNFGLARTQGLSDYLLSLGVDSTQKKNFIEGFLKGAQNLSMADLAHAAGIQVGQQVAKSWVDGLNQQLFSADSTQTVNVNDLIAGFVAGYMGNPTDEQLTLASNIVDMKMKALQEINNEKLYGANREAGEKFLAENKTKEGVQTTASGLQYKVIKEGKGAIPTKDDKVRVLYTGKTIDG
ncbi:MAG: FKBP-type peptidyl-prolyl cis-trans isomerase, partial [Bacteroidaceae bacterium]|nr:FKBP-type peptidyl-prolyl cis-trans isomerase [Bacteroidaceae bacterium]